MYRIISLLMVGFVYSTPVLATTLSAKGITLSTLGSTSSLGFQRYHHGIGLWSQRCETLTESSALNKFSGHPISCWQLDSQIGLNTQTVLETEDALWSGTLLTSHLTLDLSKGIVLGERDAKIGLFTGVGGDIHFGGINQFIWTIKPSLLTDIQIHVPINEKNLLSLSGGYRFGLHRANPSMTLGWGIQW